MTIAMGPAMLCFASAGSFAQTSSVLTLADGRTVEVLGLVSRCFFTHLKPTPSGTSKVNMQSSADYSVTVSRSEPRIIAAVSARLPVQRVPAVFASYLKQVYDAAQSGAVHLDGQNVFVYRDVPDFPGEADVDFGVGATAPFAPVRDVRMTSLPTGEMATTIHWGAYSGLGLAHSAVIEWCRAHGGRLTGTRWEVYGHWTSDEAQQQTVVCYLLSEPA